MSTSDVNNDGTTAYSRDVHARAKTGTCKLCGRVGPLTKTHAPARASGNFGGGRRTRLVVGDDGITRYGLSSREEQDGMWDRWFCESCNNRTGLWDEEYLRWCPDLLAALHDLANAGNRIAFRSVMLDPGAFVRSLWACEFALADNLRAACPDVAASVLSGDPVAPPAYRLKLAATREDQFAQFVLPHSVNVTAPPFAVSLVWPRMVAGGQGVEMFDTGRWLLAPAGVKSPVDVTLPIVRTLGEDGEWFPVLGQPVID